MAEAKNLDTLNEKDEEIADELDTIFKELFMQCETVDKLSDELCSKLEKLSDTERQQLVSRTNNDVTPLFLTARRGVLDIVNYLLVKCKADVNQFCRCYGERNEPLKMTALTEAQNVDIARCLLEHGAEHMSTALRVHICSSRFEVADYLVSKGADINYKQTEMSNTCLDYVHSDPQKYELLLSYGANVNAQNELQETPLHTAVKEGKLFKIKLLLKHGADHKLQNLQGDDVLRLSCRSGREQIFQYLIKHVKYSDAARANAHELMGAAYMTNEIPCSDYMTIKHWKKALRIRLNNGGTFLERELNDEPLIKNVTEFRTIDDLRRIQNCSRSLLIQVMLINYRILGYKDETTIDALYDVYNNFNENYEFKEALYLIMRIIYLHIKNKGVVQYNTRESALKAAILILDIAEKDGIEQLVIHFDDILAIVDVLWAQLVDPNVNINVYNVIAVLLDVLVRMSKSVDQLKMLNRLVARMVKKRYCNHDGRSLLHVVVSIKGTLCLVCTGYFSPFPQLKKWDIRLLPVVQLLLECGHDVDALDCSGSSPLHLAVSKKCNMVVVNCLLEHGAHIDRINAKAIRPCYRLDTVPGFDTFNHVTLKCLAARTITDHGVPYKDFKFPALNAFIAMH